MEKSFNLEYIKELPKIENLNKKRDETYNNIKHSDHSERDNDRASIDNERYLLIYFLEENKIYIISSTD